FATLSDIACDLGKTYQLSRFIFNRIDNDMSPKTGAVFAHSPAFIFKAAVACGNLECSHGQVVGAIRFGIEARKMSANDLVAAVAFNALSAGVPVSDNACRGQHVNGVVN